MKIIKQNSWRRISQSEIRNSVAAESEGGQKFIPPNPLSFCPPERSVSFLPREARQWVSFCQKMFEQSCIIPPQSNFPIFAQPIRPREARPISSGKFPKVKFWCVYSTKSEPILNGTDAPPCRRSLTLASQQKSFLLIF